VAAETPAAFATSLIVDIVSQQIVSLVIGDLLSIVQQSESLEYKVCATMRTAFSLA